MRIIICGMNPTIILQVRNNNFFIYEKIEEQARRWPSRYLNEHEGRRTQNDTRVRKSASNKAHIAS